MKTTCYSAPWGRPLIVISVTAIVLCALASVLVFQRGHGVTAWAALLFPGIILGSLPFTIRGYAITDDAILVRRLFWKTRLPLSSLESAQYEPGAMRGSLRIFGNGGLFSFTGRYRNKQLGSYRAFVTDPRQTVVLRFSGRTVVISPASPGEFVEKLNSSGAGR
jgi:hypothetical protein